jgi:hypothetical protein
MQSEKFRQTGGSARPHRGSAIVGAIGATARDGPRSREGVKEAAMKLTRDEQRVLGDALMELSRGEVRLFLDMMWLGFGDRWTPLLEALVQHGFVTMPDAEAFDGARITERGVRLAQRLEGRLARSA